MNVKNPPFSVVRGSAVARIALSFVHARDRIDLVAAEILAIEARAEQTFFCDDTGAYHTFQLPHVQLEFAPHIGARIHRLTSQILDEELALLVDGEVIVRPVVREPIGWRGHMSLSANDMDEAEQLAGRLRRCWVNPVLRVV